MSVRPRRSRSAPRRQALVALGLVGLMAAFGLSVYLGLGTLQSKAAQVVKPTDTRPAFTLPGTIILAQHGVLYQLRNGKFTALIGPAGNWTQPALLPGGQRMIAVSQTGRHSTITLLDANGHVVRPLVATGSPLRVDNHWTFYPRVTPNGTSVFYAYDLHDPYAGYLVDFAILERSLVHPAAPAVQWTIPNNYTGGDVEPVPLANGSLLYAKYNIDAAGHSFSQLWLQTKPGGGGGPLTTPQANCSEPALSPSQTEMAMVCVNNRLQISRLEVASFTGNKLGPLRVVSPSILAASPTWGPSGNGLIYLAPAGNGRVGPFQLWWLPNPTAARPSAPKQVTQHLDLTATSQPAWGN